MFGRLGGKFFQLGRAYPFAVGAIDKIRQRPKLGFLTLNVIAKTLRSHEGLAAGLLPLLQDVVELFAILVEDFFPGRFTWGCAFIGFL